MNVADASLSAIGAGFGQVEGQTFRGQIATVRDSNATGLLTDLSATVDWGDGTAPERATLTAGGGGAFLVSGNHKFNEEGNFTIRVTSSWRRRAGHLDHDQGGHGNAPHRLGDRPGPTDLGGGHVVLGRGGDLRRRQPDRADRRLHRLDRLGRQHRPTTGVITQLPTGVFQVSGTHTYAEFGNYPISTTIRP